MSTNDTFFSCTTSKDRIELVTTIVGGAELDHLKASAAPGRACVYASFSVSTTGKRSSYVGSSGGDGSARLTFLPTHQPVETALLIADIAGRLTAADARVLERLTYQSLAEDGIAMVHPEPHGAWIAPDRYAALRLAFGEVALAIKRAGLAFATKPDRLVIAGPRAWQPPSGIEAHSHELTLVTKKSSARARRLSDGTFLLEVGSNLAPQVSTNAAPITRLRRLEHLHSGTLREEGGRLVVMLPIRFGSLSAMTRYCSGHQGANIGTWQTVEKRKPRRGIDLVDPVLSNLLSDLGTYASAPRGSLEGHDHG